VLALALLLEALARRTFHSPERPSSGPRTGPDAALILLSSFGLFLFTRILIPDAMVYLFTTLALYAFWGTEELDAQPHSTTAHARRHVHPQLRWITYHPTGRLRLYCGLFALACALNVLTKGLINVVFPVAIGVLYLLLTRGLQRTLRRLRELHPWATFETFFLIAAPDTFSPAWPPPEGHPAPFRFIFNYTFPLSLGRWIVPLPTDGNTHGWFWFLLHERAPVPLPQPACPPRVQHRSALALLGPVFRVDDALVGLPLQGYRLGDHTSAAILRD
jgi:4-amino-4-deoxy-L-arabinose transferase-like glycosyltransferase